MILLNLAEFVGRFHPVLVHLPIGILLMACVFQLLGLYPRYSGLLPVVPVVTFWGMVTAVLSCISGFFLASNGDYDEAMVNRHQYLGLGVAVAALILYLLQKRAAGKTLLKAFSIMVILLVTITGHLGGSITHGPDYLNFAVIGASEYTSATLKPIPHIQQANVYANVVHPIMEARCMNCHGPSKQKGKLRLDDTLHLMKGGKNGKVIVAGKPDESELIKHMLLPLDNDNHMPPKGKPQPSKNELTVLQWWVQTGADFNKKVSELSQDKQVKEALLGLESGATESQGPAELPDKPVEPASAETIGKLREAGIAVMPVTQNSNYLSVNFIAADSSNDSYVIGVLEPIKKQLLWLKLDNAHITDAAMGAIASCTSLVRLQLSNTAVTDKGLLQLQKLGHLQSLNLVGTQVTAQGLKQLKGLKNLKAIYLYHTPAASADWKELQQALPGTTIDTGGYSLPMLSSDTTLVKLPGN